MREKYSDYKIEILTMKCKKERKKERKKFFTSVSVDTTDR